MFVEETTTSLTDEQLEQALREQAAHVDAGVCRLLELAAECERRSQWAGEGTTFATWLAWRCSLLPRQARAHERIAERLDELPLIHAAFARGEISYAKVSSLVRVADAENEAKLRELAEGMTASQRERSGDAQQRLKSAVRPLGRFPRLGPELGGRWSGFRFVLGPWRWMLVVYVYFEDDDRVIIVTVQDARSSRAARSGT
jgi:plasmid stabilization system protein ParE